MLPITKMIYNQSILTTTQYEDQHRETRDTIFLFTQCSFVHRQATSLVVSTNT
jgi:hypothetical protein